MIETSRDHRAIVVVDPQPDFFEGGTLPITGATMIAERIAEYLTAHGGDYSLRIVTQDWHLDPGDHWSDHPDYVTTWPVHCAADTDGARVHAALANVAWDVVIRKGQHEGAYSGFEGTTENGATLADRLAEAGVTSVTIVGFATDHCVKATALDARSLGLQVTLALDLCAGADPATTRDAISEMIDADVVTVTSKEL